MAGYFVSVEGVEGVGKSTIIQFIQSLFVELVSIILIRASLAAPRWLKSSKLLLDKRDEGFSRYGIITYVCGTGPKCESHNNTGVECRQSGAG